MNQDAVEDAKRNAQLNSKDMTFLFSSVYWRIQSLEIDNIEFIADRIESVIHKLVGKYDQQRLVAILDPPRAGVRKYYFTGEQEWVTSFGLLDRKVIQTLRSAENIKVLGYVSCNPPLATPNFVEYVISFVAKHDQSYCLPSRHLDWLVRDQKHTTVNHFNL